MRAINDSIELVSVTNQFKFEAPDGKRRASDAFLDWFTYSDNTIDGQSKKKTNTLAEK